MTFKRITIAIIALLLVGCGVSKTTLSSRVNVVLQEMEALSVSPATNHRRNYFDYYLPKHIGKRFSDTSNAVFVRNQREFYMYLDASHIIIETYYKNLSANNNESTSKTAVQIGTNVYQSQGSMKNFHTSVRSYDISIDEVGGEYLVFLRYGALRFTALLPLSEIEETIYDMFLIARSAKIDNEAVLADYSNKSVVVITNKYDLFETMFPESGVIAHVINQDKKGNIHEEETQIPGDDLLPIPPGTIHEEPTGDGESADGEE